MQSHNTLPPGVRTSNARWPMAKTAAADADQARVVFVETVHVAFRERLERSPGLSARRHVLPLLFADGALCGRLRAFRILRAASGADEKRHGRFQT